MKQAILASDPAGLVRYASTFRRSFMQAAPFPHVTIDGLFQEPALDQLVDAFPPPGDDIWQRWSGEHEEKHSSTEGDLLLPEPIQNFLRFLNSACFMRFVEAVTGQRGLVPDPFYHGAGITQVLPGGRLDIHEDFNRHAYTGLDRRVSVFVYLNRDWREEYGGDLELWDETGCVSKIAPRFNRLFLFLNQQNALHGHPAPLNCPAGRRRLSISSVYYQNPFARQQLRGYRRPRFVQ